MNTIGTDLDAEFDAEIAVRERLLETLRVRLQWAQLMQQAVQSASGHAAPETFRAVALETLSVIESPSTCILEKDPVAPPSVHKAPRPAPRKTLLPVKKPAFLYLRSTSLPEHERDEGQHLYLLKCPTCHRTAFTSLQGLLNHARLTHALEWGTHDDCIRACAVPDNDLDPEAGVEVGLGPSGILPGLRSIFQMAVQKPEDAEDLNQTLGIHEDTPALAPYLGKTLTKRTIKVWDEQVDVEECDHRLAWRVPFSHRNFVESGPAAQNFFVPPAAHDQEQHSDDDRRSGVNSTSRFHFIARIVITDRSLWVPPGQRSDDNEYKWMISVDAPSYSYHITEILRSLAVSCDESSVTLPPPCEKPPFVIIGTASKPFLANIALSFVGSNGSPEGRVLNAEHWVDASLLTSPLSHYSTYSQLEASKSQNVIHGDDQVLDIELSTDATLKPRETDYTPITARSLWNQPFISLSRSDGTSSGKATKAKPTRDPYDIALESLVKLFPLAERGLKGPRVGTRVPYMLSPTLDHFKALTYGRRKAIEWARARAIRDAYHAMRGKEANDLPILSVGDVFQWLRSDTRPANGHPLADSRPPVSTIGASQSNTPTWCRFCGLENSRNGRTTLVKAEREELPCQEDQAAAGNKIAAVSHQCSREECLVVPPSERFSAFPPLPPIFSDLPYQALPLEPDSSLAWPKVQTTVTTPRTPPCSAPDPTITMTLCGSLRSAAATPTDKMVFPLARLGQNRRDAEQAVLPASILAVATQHLIKILVKGALNVANSDLANANAAITAAASATADPDSSGRRLEKGSSRMRRILTPNHIVRGMLSRRQELQRELAQGNWDERRKRRLEEFELLLHAVSRVGVATHDNDGFELASLRVKKEPVEMEL